MKKILKNKYFWIVTVFIFLSVLLFYSSIKKSEGSNLSVKIISFITSPFQKITYNVSDNINSWIKDTFNSKEFKQKNSELQAEVNNLRKQLIEYNKYKIQNEEMMKLLNMTDSYSSFKKKPGLVIGKIMNDPFKSFIIDKGSDDDIKLYDAVITPEGFVGYITEINSTTSVIKTILDQNISIGVYNTNNGEAGIITGAIDLAYKNNTKMKYLSRQTTTKSEDILVTSGIGDKFPSGLLVGKIIKLKQEPSSTSYFGLVKPFCDFNNLKHVFVITSFSNEKINNQYDNPALGESHLIIGASKPVKIEK